MTEEDGRTNEQKVENRAVFCWTRNRKKMSKLQLREPFFWSIFRHFLALEPNLQNEIGDFDYLSFSLDIA